MIDAPPMGNISSMFEHPVLLQLSVMMDIKLSFLGLASSANLSFILPAPDISLSYLGWPLRHNKV